MENYKYKIEPLIWEREFFKINSAKVTLNKEISIKDINNIKNNIQKNNYKFITIKNKKNNPKNNQYMYLFGNIFLADINVQFIKKITTSKKNIKNIQISNKVENNNDIINLSKHAFNFSRFQEDKKLKNGNRIYEHWVKNSFLKTEKFFSCYYINGHVKAYILFSINKQISTIIIELIAVETEKQHKGIGGKLIDSIENFAINNNIKYIQVGTQINNIIAQNFYIKNKFEHKENNTIYHLWR